MEHHYNGYVLSDSTKEYIYGSVCSTIPSAITHYISIFRSDLMPRPKEEKDRIVNEIMTLLIQLADYEENDNEKNKEGPTEMLTISECVETIHGVTPHTIRTLVSQGLVKSVRVGEEGKRGKILVNKADLKAYFGS